MKNNYLIIGNGNVAKHFLKYFTLKKIQHQSWNRSESISDLASKASKATHILILIKDSAIEEFFEAHKIVLQNKICIHFSGSLISDQIIGCHPLHSFSSELFNLKEYQKIPFVCEAENKITFSELFPELSNPFSSIPCDKKAYYHALCVMSGNFSNILWNKIYTEFDQLNIPKEVCDQYLERIFKNIQKDPYTSLTGPLQRRDTKTINTHTQVLKNDKFASIYKAFKELYL